jgi:hypothetical protein
VDKLAERGETKQAEGVEEAKQSSAQKEALALARPSSGEAED